MSLYFRNLLIRYYRFLWVRLQIEALRFDCKTNGEIRTALDRLPRDLPETYKRCLERVPDTTRQYTLQMLKWVTFAERPLLTSEIQEAIAFYLTDRQWNQDKVPMKSRVLEFCANLVVEDEIDKTVRLTHPSVRQFLLDEHLCPKEYWQDPAYERELGELCVNYLSFTDFSHQVQRVSPSMHDVALPNPMRSMAATLPRPLQMAARILPRGFKDHKPTTTRAVRFQHAVQPTDDNEFGFLDYARQSWADQTKSMSRQSPVWEQFEALTLGQNTAWKLQPWSADVTSHSAYLHALLAWATRKRHLPLIRIFLEHSQRSRDRHVRELCDLPYAYDGLPALHVASRLGFTDVVTHLLGPCNVNAKGPNSMTALHYAVEKNHVHVIEELLTIKRIKANSLSSSQESPIELAVRVGSLDAVRLLIQHDDVRANLKGRGGEKTLLLAVKTGHHEVVQLLIQQSGVNVDVNLTDNCSRTPILLAAQKGDFELIRLLLAQRKDIDADSKDSTGRTPLSWAAEKGYCEVVKLLIQRNDVDVNSIDDGFRRTPLSWAEKYGN